MRARQKREDDGPASRFNLASLLGQQRDPVGIAQQKKILARDRALHHRAGYAGRKTGHLLFLQSLPTEQTFLWRCLEILLEAFEVSGYERGTPGSVLETTAQRRLLTKWAGLAAAIAPGMEGAFKFMKYKLAAFFAACMDVELPKRPFPPQASDNPLQVVGGRRARRFVHSIKRASEDPQDARAFDRLLTLAVNVLQAKKGLPRPDQAMLASAALKTFNELTTARQSPILCYLTGAVSHPPERLSWGDVDDDSDEKAGTSAWFDWYTVRREVRRTVQELLPRGGYTLSERLRPFLPSTSANYISSRANAGAVGAILEEHSYVLEGLRAPDAGVKMSQLPVNEEAGVAVQVVDVDYSSLQARFDAYYARIVADAETEPALAQPVALAEALKTRVITKGPALLNTALKPLQRFLWTALSKHRCFQLIGRPVDERVLLHVLGANLRPGQSFVSGDYTNATNELDARMSNIIVDEIAEWCGLTDLEHQLFKRSLTGHVISLDGKTAQQANGQLMGSVTSFPVLCIANFAICRYAMEVGHGQPLQTSKLPLLVNGDDCLFRTNDVGRVAWERAAAFVGLTPSVGKCYVSTRFVNVNSTNFAFSPAHAREERWLDGSFNVCPPEPASGEDPAKVCVRMNPYRMTRFVNFGLMYGLKRSTGTIGVDDLADPMDGIGARHRELLASCPGESRHLVDSIFFRHHLSALKRARVPWFLPEWLGGLGLIGRCDDWSLQLAFWALTNWGNLKSRPATGKGAQPWRVRQLCQQKYLSKLPQALLNDAQSEKEDQVLGLLSAATIFDSSVALADIFQSGSEGRAILRHNEQFWSKLRLQGHTRPLPAPSDVWEESERSAAFQASLWTMHRPRYGVVVGDVRTLRRMPVGTEVGFDSFLQAHLVKTFEWGIRSAERRLRQLDAEQRMLDDSSAAFRDSEGRLSLARDAQVEKLLSEPIRSDARLPRVRGQTEEEAERRLAELLPAPEAPVAQPVSLWREAKTASRLERKRKTKRGLDWNSLFAEDEKATISVPFAEQPFEAVGSPGWIRRLQLRSNSDYLSFLRAQQRVSELEDQILADVDRSRGRGQSSALQVPAGYAKAERDFDQLCRRLESKYRLTA